jgi:hypothetical protein
MSPPWRAKSAFCLAGGHDQQGRASPARQACNTSVLTQPGNSRRSFKSGSAAWPPAREAKKNGTWWCGASPPAQSAGTAPRDSRRPHALADPPVSRHWRAPHHPRPDAPGYWRAGPLAHGPARGSAHGGRRHVPGPPGRRGSPPGLLLLFSAALFPDSLGADRTRRSELERELAGYSTPAQRCDVEAMLDRYPDDMTNELRVILARQAMAAGSNRIPGAGGY